MGDVFALVSGCHRFLTISPLRGAPGSMGVALSSSLACIQVRSRSDVTGRLYACSITRSAVGRPASPTKPGRCPLSHVEGFRGREESVVV